VQRNFINSYNNKKYIAIIFENPCGENSHNYNENFVVLAKSMRAETGI